jgi:putative DNA primase/helicase
VWVRDESRKLVNEVAKQVARSLFRLATHGDVLSRESQRDALLAWAKRSESRERINAMVELAAGIPGVLVEHDELDRYPELLNVLNGTVDLRTGELRDHDPEHLLTKQCPVVYDPTAVADLWDRCLETWQPDAEMRRYLQVIAGVATTGYPVEEFHVHHGGGGNGKGKFFGAVMDVLGPYTVVPHKSLLVSQKHEQHETVMADLHGARLAVAAETDRGARLDEEKVKSLTGGDVLAARRLYENRWEFRPTHLLCVHTNYRPLVRGTDEGVWRRLRLIPWAVTIPEADRDPALPDKLRGELPGILNWSRGCPGVAGGRAPAGRPRAARRAGGDPGLPPAARPDPLLPRRGLRARGRAVVHHGRAVAGVPGVAHR